jgi:steroid delta-isomerase-like uncharacterized protein
MTTQANKAIAHRVFDEVWSQGRFGVADHILAPDFIGRPGGLGEPLEGAAAAKEFIARLREGFPDITFRVDEMIAEGDTVATRWTATGTNDGEFMGYEPTEREATIRGMSFFRFVNGVIAEGWTQLDTLGLMKAVGAVREPART